jgi:outer membrane protein W
MPKPFASWSRSTSMARLRRYSVLAVASTLLSVSALAADSGFSGGVRLGADLIPSAKVVTTADTPTAEAFVRLSLASSTAVELTVGYRHYSYSEFGGRWSEAYSLTQVPVSVGLHYAFVSDGGVSPFLGVGLHCSISRDSYSSYLYPNFNDGGERSRGVFGAYGHLGLLVPVSSSVFAEGIVRYVLNPISSGTGEPSNQNYLGFRVGGGVRF